MGIILDAATRFRDGIANVISGLGGSTDASRGAYYYVPPLSRDQIEAAYRTSGLARKIHDIPALDATRAWRTFKADDAIVGALEKEEKRLGLREKTRKAETWSRLYGGVAMMMGIRGDDPAEPLEVERVGKGDLEYLHVITRHEITITQLNMDPGSPQYGEPLEYIINGGASQVRIHPSRMIRFVSKDLPDTAAMSEGGWGDPLLRSLQDAVKNADSTAGHFAALVGKAKVDTLTIPGLNDMITTTEGEQRLMSRVRLAQLFESQFSTKLLHGPTQKDGAADQWDTQQITWSGMPEMQTMFWQAVAAFADIPMTRMMGMSPAGLNSTGDGDLANYYNMISAQQELFLRPRLETLDEVLIRSAIGNRPEEIYWTFNPLYIESDEVRAKNAKARAEATKIYAETGTVPSTVLMEAVKSQLIDSEEYPAIEGAYDAYDAAGAVDDLEEPETPEADNDNQVTAAIERLTASGMSATDAAVMVHDALDGLGKTEQ
jgi:uncharacterized protein